MPSSHQPRLVAWFDQLLPPTAFPRDDHRRRIRASFVLALAALQGGASVLFSVSELVAGHHLTAALLAIGALLPIWPGIRLRRDGRVERWSQVFVANMYVLLGLILLGSGGRSIGVVMALPAMLLVSSLVSSGRQIAFWGVLVVGLLLLANLLRPLPGPWWINIDPDWARDSINRVPVILALCLLGMAALLHVLIEAVFADLAETRLRETAAAQRALVNQERFADFADLAADWFWETDADLRLTYVSPGITAHTGLRPEQVLGAHPVAIVQPHARDDDQLREFEAKMARGEAFVDERMPWRDEHGALSIFRNAGRPRRDANGRFLGYRGAVTNITENWRLTRELERLARTDPLTGLLNRRAFGMALAAALADARANASSWWLLQLDLDHFKAVNDASGHAVGDSVLLRVADLMRECGLPTDTLARVGGDEFCALLRDPDADAISDYADLILAGFARLELEFGHAVGASIGIVRLDASEDSNRQLKAVDDACYRAKREGRGRVVVG